MKINDGENIIKEGKDYEDWKFKKKDMEYM